VLVLPIIALRATHALQDVLNQRARRHRTKPARPVKLAQVKPVRLVTLAREPVRPVILVRVSARPIRAPVVPAIHAPVRAGRRKFSRVLGGAKFFDRLVSLKHTRKFYCHRFTVNEGDVRKQCRVDGIKYVGAQINCDETGRGTSIGMNICAYFSFNYSNKRGRRSTFSK